MGKITIEVKINTFGTMKHPNLAGSNTQITVQAKKSKKVPELYEP